MSSALYEETWAKLQKAEARVAVLEELLRQARAAMFARGDKANVAARIDAALREGR